MTSLETISPSHANPCCLRLEQTKPCWKHRAFTLWFSSVPVWDCLLCAAKWEIWDCNTENSQSEDHIQLCICQQGKTFVVESIPQHEVSTSLHPKGQSWCQEWHSRLARRPPTYQLPQHVWRFAVCWLLFGDSGVPFHMLWCTAGVLVASEIACLSCMKALLPAFVMTRKNTVKDG